MADVRMPDGTVVRFPDTMSREQIKGLITTKFPDAVPTQTPTEGAAGDFARQASAMTQNPARAQYDALPEWQKPLVAASDIGSLTADGATFGFLDEAAAAARAPFTDKTFAEELADQERRTNAARRRSGGAGTVAELAGGLKTALAMPSAGGAALDAGQGLKLAVPGFIADGAVMGALAGAGESGTVEERLQNAATGAKFGMATGAAAPLLISGGSKLVQKVVSPFATTAERSKAVQTLAREGIETTAGQKTGSKALRYAEGEIGGAKAADLIERQGEQFTSAALKRAGIDAKRATPDVIDEAFDAIGNRFDELAARNVLQADDKFIKDLRTAFDEYGSMVPEAARAPVVTDLTNDVVTAFKTKGQLDGEAYQALRSRVDRMARGSKDPQLSGFLRGLRTTLDDGMERSILRANPKDAGKWRDVRKQYRNMLVLEDAATRAGASADLGLISPAALRGAAKMKEGRRAFARGKGDFDELARAGNAVLERLPDSGTASRLAVRNLGAMAPSIVGAGAGGAYGAQDGGGLMGSLTGALAGFLAPKAIGQLMMSKQGQKYLANQLLRSGVTPEKRELVRRVLNYGGSQSIPALAAQ